MMTITRYLPVALWLASPVAAAQTQQAPLAGGMRATEVGAEPMMRVSAGVYIAVAAAQHRYEIAAAAIARSRSRNEAIRRLAGMIGADHQGALSTLTRTGVRPAAVPAPLAERFDVLLQLLRSASAEQFDQEYLRQVADRHRHSWALQSGYASDGADAALRQVAQQGVAMEEAHLHRLPMRPMRY